MRLKHERLTTIPGQPPNLQRLPAGCAFRNRCELPYRDLRAPSCRCCGPSRPEGARHATWPRIVRFGARSCSVTDLKVHFRIGGGLLSRRPAAILKAVDGVNFELRPGETLGLVGESGCGKSTLGRAVLRLLPNATGRIVWLGQDLAQLSHEAMRRKRQEMQIIFQDPLAALNPRMPVGEIIAEPLKTFQPDLLGGRDEGARAGDDGEGRPAAEPDQPLSARVLRRPVPAHRHRAGHDQRARS